MIQKDKVLYEMEITLITPITLDKREYLMTIFLFLIETICCVTPLYVNHLLEMVLMKGLNISFMQN